MGENGINYPEFTTRRFAKKVDPIEAVQFTGGEQSGKDIVFWVRSNDRNARWVEEIPAWESNDGKSSTAAEPEHLALRTPRGIKDVMVGDWVYLDDENNFRSMTDAELGKNYSEV